MKLLPAILATLSFMGTMILHKVILECLMSILTWIGLRNLPEPEELAESD